MGKGGMRCGAGRPGWHVKAEHCRSIDARRWAREGILQAGGGSGGWRWTDPGTGAITAEIGYAVTTGAVELIYTMNGEPMRQRVLILATGCNYGGRRYWFGCPWCGKRVAILYLRNRGFACRMCNRIAYASQSEDELGRTWRKQSKIERMLGDDCARLKGMHRTTHERMQDVIAECEERRDAGLAAFMQRYGWPL
jgi:endogenous inhibitor of DNA gyrase (YacG/DUF329 family)